MSLAPEQDLARPEPSPLAEPKRSPTARDAGGLAAALSRAPWLAPGLAIAVYVVLAAIAYWPVEPFSKSQVLGCACSDPIQETWFLAWPADALRHGLNPFFSPFLNAPDGVNLAVNTSMPLLGLLGAPLTWLRGPVAAYNALMRLSFAASATSMLFVVRRFTSWWPAAFLAGLLYGFSPYMVGQGFGHLFLTFVPLPPLIALCAYTLVKGGPVRTPAGAGSDFAATRRFVVRRGLALGAVCTAQFFISIEVLTTTIICTCIVAVVAALAHPREALRRLSFIWRGAAAAAVVFVPLVAYPVWFYLRGPQRIIGPPHAIANIAPIKADLLGSIVPTLNQLIGPSHLLAIGTAYSAGDRPENGAYLGVPLIALLVYLVVRCRRDHVVVLGAVLALVGLVFSLGTPLVVNNHGTSLPLPFTILLHLPLVQGVAALRLSLYEQLGAAVVLGVGLDRVRRDGWRRATADVGDAAAGRRSVAVAVVGALALVPLVPRFPYPSFPVAVPRYFAGGAAASIPSGSVVLTYPYDIDPDNDPMLWQAWTGFRFKILGGQTTTPGRDGRASSAVAPLAPSAMQALLGVTADGTASGPPRFTPGPATLRSLRDFLVRYDVSTVVVVDVAPDPALVVRALGEALDERPKTTGGVVVFSRAAPRAQVLLARSRR